MARFILLLSALLFATPALAGDPVSGTSAPMAAMPTDTDNAHTVDTLDKGEIAAAELALSRATSPDVKKLAQMMFDEHSANMKELATVLTQMKLTMSENDRSRGVKKDADAALETLKAQKGASFDKAYVDSQVKMHQDALALLDKMVAEARGAEFKDFLTRTRGAVATHLEHAKKLQAQLTGAAAVK